MKKKKSMLSILGVLLLSLTFVSSASAGEPSKPTIPKDDHGPSKPPVCTKAPCPL